MADVTYGNSSNTTVSNAMEQPVWLTAVTNTSAITLVIICALGLIGNMLSMVVVVKNPLMKTASTVFIFNLALADFLFLLSVPMMAAGLISRRWIFGEFCCRAYYGLFGVNLFASVYTLVMMSVDRFIAICCMNISGLRTVTNSIISCVIIWMVSALLILPLLMYSHYSNGQCLLSWPHKNGKAPTAYGYTYYTLSAGFVIPCILMMIFYISILVKINLQKSVLTEHSLDHKKKRNRRVTSLVLSIIAAFVICWLPHWIIQVYLITAKSYGFGVVYVLTQISTILYVFNSALNPILYGFMSASFRNAMTKTCGCNTSTRNADGSQSRGFLLSFGRNRKPDYNETQEITNSRSPKTSVRFTREHVTLLDPNRGRIDTSGNLLTVT